MILEDDMTRAWVEINYHSMVSFILEKIFYKTGVSQGTDSRSFRFC